MDDPDRAIRAPSTSSPLATVATCAAGYGPPSFSFPGQRTRAPTSREGSRSAPTAIMSPSAPTSPRTCRRAAPSTSPPGRSSSATGSRTTTLITADGSGSGEMTDVPPAGRSARRSAPTGRPSPGPAATRRRQTRFLGGENQDPASSTTSGGGSPTGPTAPTRRITGIADPEDPGCPPSAFTNFDQTSTGPCYGPLTDQEANPRRHQLAIAGAERRRLHGRLSDRRRSAAAGLHGPGLDLFLTDMHPGLTRKAATIELTRDTVDGDTAANSPLSSVAMSPGGRYLVITTVRTRFALPALKLLGEPRAGPGPAGAVRGRPPGAHAGPGDPLLSGGDIDADVVRAPRSPRTEGRSPSPRSPAISSTATPTSAPTPSSPNGSPSRMRRRRTRGPATMARPGRSRSKSDGPQIGVRAKSMAGGKVRAHGLRSRRRGCQGDRPRPRAGKPRKLRNLATATARARGVDPQRRALVSARSGATGRSCAGARRFPAARSSPMSPPAEAAAQAPRRGSFFDGAKPQKQPLQGQEVKRLSPAWQRFGNAVENEL